MSLDSIMITSNATKEWLLNQLPIKVKSLVLLYRGSTHGWKKDITQQLTANSKFIQIRQSKFYGLCKNKGPTITIIKSKADKIFGGFTQKHWRAPHHNSHEYIEDENAFIFSIDQKKIYRPIDAKKAIFIGP